MAQKKNQLCLRERGLALQICVPSAKASLSILEMIGGSLGTQFCKLLTTSSLLED